MNICIISPNYPYKDSMSYIFVKKLVCEWAKMGHRCVVLTPFSLTSYVRKIKKYVPWHYIDDTISENPVEVYNPRYFSLPKIEIGGAELNEVVVSRMMLQVLKKVSFIPDLFYCHFFRSAISGWYLSNQLNIPLFVASGESTIEKVYSPASHFSLDLFRKDIKGCVCVSSKNREEAVEKGLITDEKCIVIPNGTDLNVFKQMDRMECRKKLRFNKDDFIITCVGGFIERKGQNRIIEAVDILGNTSIKMVFIGKGDLSLRHENIIFKGQVQNSEIPLYLNSSNMFCLPTLSEGCCNSIIEAMACGLPIVSSDMPFNYDILDSQTAILVNPRDVRAISNAIQHLYEHPDICERMSTAVIEKAKLLSLERRAHSIMAFIESRLLYS